MDEIGYPYRDVFDCYTTWTSKKLFKGNINETLINGTIITRKYDEPVRSVSVGRGLLNTYDGKGYTKVVPLNVKENSHFFYQAIKQEMVNQGWTKDPSMLAITLSYHIYNPNLWILQEKRVTIEWLDSGFINLEHDVILINMKLYRNIDQNISSSIIIGNGII